MNNDSFNLCVNVEHLTRQNITTYWLHYPIKWNNTVHCNITLFISILDCYDIISNTIFFLSIYFKNSKGKIQKASAMNFMAIKKGIGFFIIISFSCANRQFIRHNSVSNRSRKYHMKAFMLNFIINRTNCINHKMVIFHWIP